MTSASTQPQPQMEIQEEHSRELGLVSALAIGIGTMIAAGIFTLSGLAVREVGSSAIVAFLMAAVVATFTALTYCEFSSIYPESGEGYLYARKTFPPVVAFFVGWSLFLGYTSSCGFYISSLASYFQEFVYHLPWEPLSGLVGLTLLTALNTKGTKESGSFQVVVTGAKVLLLIWFIGGGLMSMDSEVVLSRFSQDIPKILKTSALVFITFFGFSAIAASAGEVQNPTKNIPRAIFISMSLVTVLYTLVILSIVGANLTQYDEAAMGKAAEMFLGVVGGKVIVAGALASMISAANASIMAGSRVVLTMSQLGHMPSVVGAISKKAKTPYVAVLLVGFAIGLFNLSLGLEELAHFADAVLLMALVTVNTALIWHRKQFPDMVRGFRVPLVPLVPILGIIANLYLLQEALHHTKPALMTGGSLLLGMTVFAVWKGMQPEAAAIPGAPSRVAFVETAAEADEVFHVLVPIANPDNVDELIRLAAGVISPGTGTIVALRVITVPEQLPPTAAREDIEKERKILERAYAKGQELGVTVTSVVRIGHNVGKAILETAQFHKAGLVVLGWRGYTNTAEKILGETIDTVVSNAGADVILVKLTDKPLAGRVFIPLAGGIHAKKAAFYAARLLSDGDYLSGLELCTLVKPDATEAVRTTARSLIDEALKEAREVAAPEASLESHIVEHENVVAGISEAAAKFDVLVVGATRESLLPQMMFGSIPEELAKSFHGPVLMVRSHHPLSSMMGRIIGSSRDT
jgi:basic amino acid/polyamine antiporter, APA family